jgi:hypothetical protein
MGTRGRSGIGEFLLGSVAQNVFRQVPHAGRWVAFNNRSSEEARDSQDFLHDGLQHGIRCRGQRTLCPSLRSTGLPDAGLHTYLTSKISRSAK